MRMDTALHQARNALRMTHREDLSGPCQLGAAQRTDGRHEGRALRTSPSIPSLEACQPRRAVARGVVGDVDQRYVPNGVQEPRLGDHRQRQRGQAHLHRYELRVELCARRVGPHVSHACS